MCCIGMMKGNRVKKSSTPRERLLIKYWTGTFRCGGGEVGGEFMASISKKEECGLLDVIVEFGRSSEAFKEHMSKLYNRLLKMAYRDLEIQLAKEAYPYYKDSHAELFKTMSYSQRIAFIRNDAGERVEDLFKLTIENPFLFILNN